MKKENLISIIIPVYNAQKTIVKCLDSILRQTYKSLEILVIDDGSTDNTFEICSQYSVIDKRFHIIKIKNHGVSFARNLGLSKSNGNYICFIDSDDVIHPQFFELLYRNIIKKNVDMVSCNYQLINSYENIELKNKFDNDIIEIIKGDEMIKLLFDKSKGFVWNKIYKKSIIDSKKIGFKENVSMCEDLLFNYMYLSHCNSVIHISNPLYYYYQSSNSISNNIKNQKWFSCLEVYYLLYNNRFKYIQEVNDLILINFIYIIYETKFRCKIMKMDAEKLFSKYSINSKKIINHNYKRLLLSHNINLKQKIKLMLLIIFGASVYKIKY